MQIVEALGGPRHPEAIVGRAVTAEIRGRLGYREEAADALEKEIELGGEVLSAGHPQIQRWRERLEELRAEETDPPVPRHASGSEGGVS